MTKLRRTRMLRKNEVVVEKQGRGHYTVKAMNAHGNSVFLQEKSKEKALEEAHKLKRKIKRNPDSVVNIF